MGLDMYLYAQRTVADASTAIDILNAVPHYEDEQGWYLPLWEHYRDSAKIEDRALYATATYIVTDVAQFATMITDDSRSASAQVLDNNDLRVQVTAAYWRKANYIHDWFVTNVQGGVDNCDEYPVDAEQLAHLAHLCEQVLADRTRAAELLPTRRGFFFGDTDYDEWYFEQLQHTANEIKRVIAVAIALGGVTFSYQSSW